MANLIGTLPPQAAEELSSRSEVQVPNKEYMTSVNGMLDIADLGAEELPSRSEVQVPNKEFMTSVNGMVEIADLGEEA